MTTATVQLQVSVNGGAFTTGAITAAFGQTVAMQAAVTLPLASIRYEITDYPPGMTVPSGWSTDPQTNAYFFAPSNVTTTPPVFALPASGTNNWGILMLRLRGNTNPIRLNPDGSPNATYLPQLTDESTCISIPSPVLGLPGFAKGLTTQFDSMRQWAGLLMTHLRLLDAAPFGGGGGGGGGSPTTTLQNAFQQPAVNDQTGAVVTLTAAPSQALIGCSLSIATGGYYTVKSVSGSTATLINNLATNAAQGVFIAAGSVVAVASSNAPLGPAAPGVGQALVLQSSGSYSPQAHPFVWNVKTSIGGLPGMALDGVTDDAPALQRIFTAFGGKSSTLCVDLFQPKGQALLKSTCTYVGNVGNSLRWRGERVGATNAVGSWLIWGGAPNQDMIVLKGINQSELEELGFDGQTTARAGIWFRSDQAAAPGGESGGSPTNGVFLKKCFFNNFVSGTQWTASTLMAAGSVVNTPRLTKAFYYYTIAGGTSGASQPTWSTSINPSGAANATSDGTVSWLTVGTWTPGTSYLLNEYVADHSLAGQTIVKCTTAGTVGNVQPVFNQTVSGTTSDAGGTVWTTIAVGVNCTGSPKFPMAGGVILGDQQDNHQVATILFRDCSWQGVLAPGGTFAQVNYCSGFNSEQFKFENCSFVSCENGFYSGYVANNGITFDFCQFGNITGYCVNLSSLNNATLVMTNNLVENVLLPAPYTGLGAFCNAAADAKVDISGGELTMDCSWMPANAIVRVGGHLELHSISVSADGTLGAGAANPNNRGCIQVVSAGYSSSPGGASSTLNVTAVQWANLTEQIPVVDSNNNNLTLLYGAAGNIGGQSSYAIELENNIGTDAGGVRYLLPNLKGSAPNMFGNGILASQVDPNIVVVAYNQPRTTTSIFRFSFGYFAGVASTVKIYQSLLLLPTTKVLEVLSKVNAGFAGPGITGMTMSVGEALTPSNLSFLKATSVTAPGLIGAVTADLGPNLTTGIVQGGWYCNSAANQSINIQFTSTGANLSALTAGSLDLYVTTENLRPV